MKERFSKCLSSFSGKAVGFRCDEVILPNGKKAVREYLVHPGAVAIVPVLDSPKVVPLEKCRVVLVKQFRYPAGEITEELPAGKIDPGESALRCLPRELKEETGYSAKKFHHLISFWPTPAFSDEIIHIYWAEGLKKGKSRPDDDEFLDVKVETIGNVLKKIRTGKIRDSKTVIGTLAFYQQTLRLR